MIDSGPVNVSQEKHFIRVRAEEVIRHGSPLSLLVGGGKQGHASFWSTLAFGGEGRSHTVALLLSRSPLPPEDLLGFPPLWFQPLDGSYLAN